MIFRYIYIYHPVKYHNENIYKLNCAQLNSIDHLYWKRLEHPNIKFITKVKEGLFIKRKLDKIFVVFYQGHDD